MKYKFLIHNRVVFRTAAGAAVLYVKGTVSQKNEFQIISYVHSSTKHWRCMLGVYLSVVVSPTHIVVTSSLYVYVLWIN